MGKHKQGIYEKYIKRFMDIIISFLVIVLLGWLMVLIAVLVRMKLGSPVVFKQPRPGRNGRIFNMYKFRTMTDERDEDGNLMPDEVRLTEFGKRLRETSCDELLECFNILKGDMSLIGPRPQLVRDMVFMSEEQKRRHEVRQGLTGWAQVNGRNGISWEEKLKYDVDYVERISFLFDLKILFMTVKAVFAKEGITMENMATGMDYGDYLLKKGAIDKVEYTEKQKTALNLLMGDS